MSDGESVAASPDAGQAAPTGDQVATNEQAAPETAQAEAPEGDETDDGEPAEGSEQSEGDGEPRPRKRSSTERYRRKISYLAGEAERKAARIAELEQQLASKSEEAEPDPTKYDGGEYDPKYIKDLIAHTAKSEVRKNTGPATQQAQASPEIIAFQQEARRTFPDLEKKAAEFYEDGGRLPEHVAGAVFSSENGPAVLNHLLDNPELADEISAMTPMQAAVRIGRLDAALAKKPARTTKAPPPIAPLNGGSSGPAVDLGKADMATYVAERKKQGFGAR